MATKRSTDTDSPRKTQSPDAAVQAAPADEPQTASRGKRDDKAEARSEARNDAGNETKSGESPRPEASGPEPPPEPARVDRRIEELATQLEEANDRRLRLAADFDNYKKRSRQEQLDTMRYANATLAERLLPVLDDASLALSHAPEGVDEGWLKGVRLTFQKLEEILGGAGVERIEAVGSPFDPKLHEAVGSEETADHPEDTVVTELRRGYRMHDRVLRPALVKVARPPA